MNKDTVNFETWLARLKAVVEEISLTSKMIDANRVVVNYNNGDYAETLGAQIIEQHTNSYNQWFVYVCENLTEAEISALKKPVMKPKFNAGLTPAEAAQEIIDQRT